MTENDEITEFAKKYLDVELYPHQKLFIEMLQSKLTPQNLREKAQNLREEAIDRMVVNRVSHALTGHRIRKLSVLNAILQEINIVTDPMLMKEHIIHCPVCDKEMIMMFLAHGVHQVTYSYTCSHHASAKLTVGYAYG